MNLTANLDGKTAVITGASSGIGAETAQALGEAGANVCLAARREDRLEEVASNVESVGGTAHVVPTDVTDEEAVQELIDETVEEFGSLDILINNAGVMLLEKVEDANTDNFRAMVEVNLMAVMNATHAALPIMQEQGDGHIVNISSVAGRKTWTGASGYNATKFGVNAFSEALREEVTGNHNIRITLIEPGYVDTELSDHIPDDNIRQYSKQEMAEMDVLTAEDISRSILFAVSQPPHVDINELLIRPTEQKL